METIVVGYDGTAPAEHALRRAGDVARAFGARLVVVSVAPLRPAGGPVVPGAFGLDPYYTFEGLEDQERLDEALWRRHREQVEELFASSGVPVEFEGVSGDASLELVDVAEQRRADLIVVGTREAGFLERLLGGSVSQGVARRAHCDVLIVHPGED